MFGRGRPLQETISSGYEYSGGVNKGLKQIWREVMMRYLTWKSRLVGAS